MTKPRRLRTALGDYPATRLLRVGAVADERVAFDFAEVRPIHTAFAPMVRERAFDLSEMAVVTALQAIAYGKPLILLPVVVAARFQRGCLVGYRPRGLVAPELLAGRRVGVRAFTQTTGMWVRAALYEDYGLPVEAIRWLTRDAAHVPDFSDPPFVEHDESRKDLPERLVEGELDGAIMGADLPSDLNFAPIIPNHRKADQAFFRRHGFVPINHMVVVDAAVAAEAPEAVRGAYAALARATVEAASGDGEPEALPIGFERLTYPLGFIIDEMLRQELLPRFLSVEEVLRPAAGLLQV